MSTIDVFTPADMYKLDQGYRVTFTMSIGEADPWPARMIAGLPMRGRKETFWWPEPTVQIRKRNASGKDIQLVSLKWNKRTIAVDPYGIRFQLDRYQDVDLQAFNRIDAGATFGDQCGAKAATFIHRGVKYLLQNGSNAELVNVWSGKPLFATDHKISSASDYTFSNKFVGMPLNATNLAAGMSYLAQIQDGTGDFLGLHRSVTLVHGSVKRARSEQLLNTEWYTDLFNGANAASAQSIYYKGKWGFQEPIADPYFDFAPSKWWLVSNTWKVPEQAPLHMPELEPFTMTSWSGANAEDLARREELLFDFKGRVGFMGGRPERILEFDATGDVGDNDEKMIEIIANL